MLDFLRRFFGATKSGPGPGQRSEEEDPAVTLERAARALEHKLAEAGESSRAVAAMRHDLEMRRTRADEMVARHAEQAERAMALGREDLARRALAARWEAERMRDELRKGLAEVERQQASLEAAREALRERTEQLRAREAEMGARLAAAESRLRLREAMVTVSENVADVTRAQGRLEEELEATRARTMAPAELAPRGAAIGGQEDPLERELARLERDQRVGRELDRIKREVLAERDASQAEEGEDGGRG